MNREGWRTGSEWGDKVQRFDCAMSCLLVLLGCIHGFMAAPMNDSSLTPQALWPVSAGLALWYAGFVNLLRVHAETGDRLVHWLCVVSNASLLGFVAVLASVRGNWLAPETWLPAGTLVVLSGRAVVALIRCIRS